MFKFFLFLFAFDQLLTQEDLKRRDSSTRLKTELVCQDETVGIQVSEGNQVLELNGSLPRKIKGRSSKGSYRAGGVKVGAGYKYTSKLSRKTSISYKGGVEAIDPFPKAGPGFDSKTSYGLKGGLGYQKELDNGIVFFVDTGLSYPISKSGPTAPQQDKEKSSRKQSFKPMPEPAVSIGFKY